MKKDTEAFPSCLFEDQMSCSCLLVLSQSTVLVKGVEASSYVFEFLLEECTSCSCCCAVSQDVVSVEAVVPMKCAVPVKGVEASYCNSEGLFKEWLSFSCCFVLSQGVVPVRRKMSRWVNKGVVREVLWLRQTAQGRKERAAVKACSSRAASFLSMACE